MRVLCRTCGVEPVTSPTSTKCERCLYAEEMGEDAARRQYVATERAKRAAKRATTGQRK